MAIVDDKIVAASFESSKFESGVSNTISSIDKLKAALKFPDAGKGLEGVNDAVKRVDLGHISRGIDDVKGSLGAFRLAAIAIFADIAQTAISAGAKIVKSFSFGPALTGFQEYSTNLNAVQTILANTQASGATLKDVNSALLDLNKYSDQTIYNFSQMAKNIGTFTAAGVDLKTATGSIKGIANLAALSGSNSEQASTAMYQLSQAISAGRVGLQDWNSVVNAGMGGTVFQRALAQTAVAMGTIKEESLKLVGPMKNVSIDGESFRQSMQAGPGKQSWLSSKVLTATLKQFTGDLTDAELKAQGFNEAQIKAIQQTAVTAKHAATEVKTITQVLDVAKETAGSGWAQTWQLVFGDFGEAKKSFTSLSNAINGFINSSSDARNKVLGDWKALGGRVVLIDALKTSFHNLTLIVKPIRDAFRDIFPATTGRDLLALTKRFQDFAEALKPSKETVHDLRRTFRGLFALLDIGKQVITGIFTAFESMFKALGGGNGSFLNLTGNIGDFLVALDKTLKKGNVLNTFFEKLGEILAIPIKGLSYITSLISNLFSEFSPEGFIGGLGQVTHAASPFQKVLSLISDLWDKFTKKIGTPGDIFQKVLDTLVNFVQEIGPSLGKAAANMNFEAILTVIRTGLLFSMVSMFKQFLGGGSFIQQLGGQGIISRLTSGLTGKGGIFGSLTSSMTTMQNNVRADTLKKIAIAIALLTASVVALSFIDPERLKSALAGMAVAFAQLLAAMAILDKISSGAGFVRMPFITASMILLAGAIDLLSISVIALSRLDWNELAKGLGAVGFLLATISAASIPLSKNSAGMIRSGIGIIAIAVAMKILASAVKDFSRMNMVELAKGLGSVAVALGVLVGAAKLMPKSMALTGAGVIIVAVGLKLLAGVVERFGKMDLRVIGRGLAGIAGGLVVIALAMKLMPITTVLSGAGLILVAAGLKVISGVIQKMGGMTIKQLAKGLISMAGALGILAGGLHLMSGTLAGSASLAIAAGGLALLAPALVLLGKQSWSRILKGLGALAGSLVVLAAAGLVMAPSVPVLIGLGAALALIGIGMAGVGAGIALIAAGISALAVAGPTGIAIMQTALLEFSAAIPRMAKNLIVGLLEIVEGISKAAPEFIEALAKIVGGLLVVVIKAVPGIRNAFEALLKAAIKVVRDYGPKIIQLGLDLILWFLKGIQKNIGQIVSAAGDLVAGFLRAIAKQIDKIVSGGAELISSFIRGIVNNISKVISMGADVILKFVSGITSNIVRVVTSGTELIVKFIGALSSKIVDVVKAGTGIITAFIRGIGESASRIVTAAVDTIINFANTLVKNAVKLADAGAVAVIKFLNGVADTIDRREPEIIKAGGRIGVALVTGMIKGLGSAAPALWGKVDELVKDIPKKFHLGWLIKSPSKVFYDIGQNAIFGLSRGFDDHERVLASATTMSKKIVGAVRDTLQTSTPRSIMYDMARYMGTSFVAGLKGSGDDIHSAFDEMDKTITDAMSSAQDKFKEENDRLTEMQRAKNIDPEVLRLQTKAVYAQLDLVQRLRHGHNLLVTDFGNEETRLVSLSKRYSDLTGKLEKARDALASAKQTRAEAIASFTSQYSTLPDIVTKDEEGNAVNQLAVYMEALKHQGDAVGAYKTTLDQLRKLGLDDATFNKLLQEGTADQEFANQLLAGGKTAVKSLNTLDAQLLSVSKTLAVNSANNLYQAGVDAAQGLVNGLESKRSAIRHTMETIAKEIVRALKKELQIKSPSKVFEEIGQFAMEGMANGFKSSSGIVTDAVQNSAKEALNSMRATMRNISGIVTDELNPNPVITPVLDLTQVRSQVPELSSLTAVGPISASTAQASSISSAQTQLAEETIAATAPTQLNFEQNNYSPESLSDVEIYRQTKNQLSELKSALGLT